MTLGVGELAAGGMVFGLLPIRSVPREGDSARSTMFVMSVQ